MTSSTAYLVVAALLARSLPLVLFVHKVFLLVLEELLHLFGLRLDLRDLLPLLDVGRHLLLGEPLELVDLEEVLLVLPRHLVGERLCRNDSLLLDLCVDVQVMPRASCQDAEHNIAAHVGGDHHPVWILFRLRHVLLPLHTNLVHLDLLIELIRACLFLVVGLHVGEDLLERLVADSGDRRLHFLDLLLGV